MQRWRAAGAAPRRELVFSRLHRFEQIDQRVPRAPLRKPRKRLNQAQRQRIGQQAERRGVVALRQRCLAALEQRENRNAEDHADLEKAAAADAVRALLVFLYLLKSNSELGGQVGLRHALGQPVDADVAANDLIQTLRASALHRIDPIPKVVSYGRLIHGQTTAYQTLMAPRWIAPGCCMVWILKVDLEN